jgi:hypothetical protein
MSPAVRHFARHYVEMVVAMLLGMVVLGIPAEAGLRALGSSADDLRADAPALLLLGMAVVMTVPMVAWMRHRRHGWTPSMEMAASMFLPTFAVIGLLGSGVVTDIGTLLMVQHVAMFPSMLAAMVLRRDEYTGHVHHRADRAVAA